MNEVDKPHPLTQEQVREALSNLGHNSYGEIAFTNVALNDLQLSAVGPLAGYPFLQRISLDDNHITSLRPLEHLNSIVYLSARNNRLVEAEVLPFLSGSASSLERLHLDGNQLASLAGLSQLPYLVDLSVSHNGVTELVAEDFHTLSGLTRFAARGNAITSIEPHVFSGTRSLRSVDLRDNMVTNLHFVAYVTTSLEVLLLSGNRITTLGAALSECHALVTLDFADNAIASVSEFCALQSAQLLRQIRVTGNPFCPAQEEEAATESAPLAPDGSASTGRAAFPEEVVAKDVADHAAEAGRGFKGTMGQPAASARRYSADRWGEATGGGEAGTVDYAALTVPSVYGVVRHVLTASRMVAIPWDTDRAAELAKLPPARQVFLQLVHLLPFLTVVNDIEVVPDDVARAKFLFAGEEPCI